MGKTEMHISCGEKSRWDWRSGNGHAAHLWYYQRHTGHRWGTYFDSMSLSQNVGCEHKVWNEQYCKWHHEAGCSKKGFGKDVRRMSDQSPFCMKSTPLVISRAFAVLLDEFQNKVSSTPSVSPWGLRQNGWDQWVHSVAASVWRYTIVSSMAERIWPDQQSLDLVLSYMSACKTLFIV